VVVVPARVPPLVLADADRDEPDLADEDRDDRDEPALAGARPEPEPEPEPEREERVEPDDAAREPEPEPERVRPAPDAAGFAGRSVPGVAPRARVLDAAPGGGDGARRGEPSRPRLEALPALGPADVRRGGEVRRVVLTVGGPQGVEEPR